jgi:hypothetical protein
MAQFDEAAIRRILLEHQLLGSEAQTCARWDLPVATLRKWKREREPWRVAVGPREWLIVALWQSSEHSVAAHDMIGWLDYHEHAVFTEAEIEAWLDGLVGEGIARRTSEGWAYARDRGPFVF